jgi:hypothetical protein
MRSHSFILALAMTVLATAPVEAQIRASIKIGPIRIAANLPIGNNVRSRGYITVAPYSRSRHGDWRRSARDWRTVTVYILNGRYYERPYRNARKAVVYRYRDQYFRAPNSRQWRDYRDRGPQVSRNSRNSRDVGRGRDARSGRDAGRGRDVGNGRDARSGRDSRGGRNYSNGRDRRN